MTRTLEELKQQESVVAPHPPQTASRSADVRHQLYLDSDEGNVGKLFDESSHLLTVFTFIKPRTPLHLHLTHREREKDFLLVLRANLAFPQRSASVLETRLTFRFTGN